MLDAHQNFNGRIIMILNKGWCIMDQQNANVMGTTLATAEQLQGAATSVTDGVTQLIQKRDEAQRVVDAANAMLADISAKARGLKTSAKRGRPKGTTSTETKTYPRGYVTNEIRRVLGENPEGLHNSVISEKTGIDNTKILGALNGLVKNGTVTKTGERSESVYKLA